MSDLRNIDSEPPTIIDQDFTNILLYGNQIYDDKTNQNNFNARNTMHYILYMIA